MPSIRRMQINAQQYTYRTRCGAFHSICMLTRAISMTSSPIFTQCSGVLNAGNTLANPANRMESKLEEGGRAMSLALLDLEATFREHRTHALFKFDPQLLPFAAEYIRIAHPRIARLARKNGLDSLICKQRDCFRKGSKSFFVRIRTCVIACTCSANLFIGCTTANCKGRVSFFRPF